MGILMYFVVHVLLATCKYEKRTIFRTLRLHKYIVQEREYVSPRAKA